MYYLKQGNVITLVQEEDSNYESDTNNNSKKTSLNMDSIMKRLFTLKNKKPIIDFLNSIYGDDIGYDAEVYYPNVENLNRNINNGLLSFRADLYIEVTYRDKLYDYAIEFQTKYEKDMGIRIFRYGFDKAVKNLTELDKNTIIINFPEPYLIVLEKEKGLEDQITLEINFPKKEGIHYEINVLKYWEYDLQKLHEENKYLLYPLQLFNYRRFMERLRESKQAEEIKKAKIEKINEHILITIKNTLEAISEAYKCGKITLEDYNEMLSVIQNLNDYFIDTYNYYKGLSKEVEVMFKSFYDPEVEKRGEQKGKENTARNLLRKGMSYEFVAETTELSLQRVKEIAKEIMN
ncbi:hypothetical protein [Clostridium tunisiense]|uniref:hypothetical protein n=1 Tax=Clostridium tunisiense TaxID=219748 RepID=UPI0002E62AAF|nr:hypothetical protein [Clostridium tunisiense]